MFEYTSSNYAPCVNMYRMYSPCCTAHQSIVSETLKHSVALWSGSILGGPGGNGHRTGKRARAPSPQVEMVSALVDGLLGCPSGMGCCYPQLSPQLGSKKTSRICRHLLLTAPWSQRNQEQMRWSRGGGWQWLLLALSLGGFTVFFVPFLSCPGGLTLT